MRVINLYSLFIFIPGIFFSSFFFTFEKRKVPLLSVLGQKIDSFALKGIEFETAVASGLSLNDCKKAYFTFQGSFREIQFLLEHISEETVKQYINGPPILSVEQNIPTINIMEPRGLQVIDEMLFEEEPDRDLLLKKINELNRNIKKIKNIFLQYDLTEADIKTAIYKDVVRIYTLQVTGFDTPGSLSGLQNSVKSLKGIRHIIKLLYSDHNALQHVQKLCAEAIGFITKNNDFNTFDRVIFYKNYIRLILEKLARWHPTVETVLVENAYPKKALTFRVGDIFTDSFFEKDFFANLPLHITDNQDIASLGKSLFYDPILSGDQTMSCATCHKPELAFTDGLQKSITNIKDFQGLRNTPTLINAIYAKGFFYDLREEDPHRVILHVVKDKTEFNSDFINIIGKLEKNPDYKTRFETHFPQEKISKYTITSAITTYIASLTDYDSPFDTFMQGNNALVDSSAIRGFNLFAGKARCATCHFIPTFSGLVPPSYKENESEILGVPYRWKTNEKMVLDLDPGRMVNGKPRDAAEHLRYAFKTPTVRNIDKTAPYMHNGSFSSLEEVMDFYNKGGGIGLGFDLPFQTLPSDPLHLQEKEIEDLIRFMKSLSGEKNLY